MVAVMDAFRRGQRSGYR